MLRRLAISRFAVLLLCAVASCNVAAAATRTVDSRFLAVSPSSVNHASASAKNALRTGVVDLRFEELRNLALSERGSRPNVLIQPFENVAVELDGESLFVNDSATIVGRLANGESGVFILSWAGTILYGMLESGLSRYTFESNRDDPWGTLRVSEIDGSSFYPCGVGAKTQEEIVAPKKLWDDKVAKSQPANHTVIEFMALYTADMANNHSGDPSAYINTLEASVTAAMSGSSVTGAAKVIRYAESTFDETAPFSYNDFNLEIYNMTNNQGDYSNMYNERTSYRGDLAVLLIDGNAVADDSPDYAICGLAGKTSAYDASVAFAVVSDGCASGDLTFAHEFSHLLAGAA